MKTLVRRVCSALACVFLVGCAGMQRGCSSCSADAFGANWVVVQMDFAGKPYRCWKLTNTSISNETQSDSIYWKAPSGNLVHLSGLYNRVQVNGTDWTSAFAEIGLSERTCSLIHSRTFDTVKWEYRDPEGSTTH